MIGSNSKMSQKILFAKSVSKDLIIINERKVNMMITTEDTISFSRETWEELKNDSYFQELIEVIEDREALREAKNETESFVDYDAYRKTRMAKMDV